MYPVDRKQLADQLRVMDAENRELRRRITVLEADRAAMLHAGFPHYARNHSPTLQWQLLAVITDAQARLAETDREVFDRAVAEVATRLVRNCVNSTP